MAQGPEPHAYNEEKAVMVERMSSYGINQDNIAKILGIAPKTLRKYYRAELDLATDKATVKVAQTLYDKAVQGDNVCMLFWLKTRAYWKENADHPTQPPIFNIDKDTPPEKAAEIYKAFIKGGN